MKGNCDQVIHRYGMSVKRIFKEKKKCFELQA